MAKKVKNLPRLGHVAEAVLILDEETRSERRGFDEIMRFLWGRQKH